MNTTLKIHNDDQLRQALNDLQLADGMSTFQLLRSLVVESRGTISLEVGYGMIPISYMSNPHMLKVNVKSGVDSSRNMQVKAGDKYLNIIISDVEIPLTFLGRLRHAIEVDGFAKFANDEIPRSYRLNPGLVKKSLEYNVKFRRDSEYIYWELTDATP